MKITSSSDWRNGVAFDTPMIVADLVPGEPTRCSGCGVASEPRPRTELWAIKHRHRNDPAGYVKFYCRTHLPVVQPAAAPSASRPAVRERRPASRRPALATETTRAMCPDCFIEVSATGVCGMCGTRVA
ncbi:MAG TPA: glucose-6-phosphate dehydrogenase [Microbacterium sp.]|uniref:glucose-6-phosphate dehydrogenase n=1 Tax=Microbacterium sp. TaxID=51671 RepID=UPI002CFE2415|nr:glucose-6-phosphate dehydrogenase [Microbacterium sp.]HWI31518.1 glucose-6-phosphate dehydrogenase [Microbacterium sp.]